MFYTFTKIKIVKTPTDSKALSQNYEQKWREKILQHFRNTCFDIFFPSNPMTFRHFKYDLSLMFWEHHTVPIYDYIRLCDYIRMQNQSVT